MSRLPNALGLALDRIDLFGVRARGLALIGMIRALRRLTERVRARVETMEVGPRGRPPAPTSAPPPRTPAPYEALLEGGTWTVRRDAALALRRHPGERTREALIVAITDPAVEVALAACEALVEVGTAEDAGRLLDLARSGTGALHPFTRAGAVWAAGTHASIEHVPALCTLVHDVNTEVSSAAIEALGRVADESALEVLWGVLEDDRGYYLAMSRSAAARALGDRGALDDARVAHLLRSETDPVVRSALEAKMARPTG